MVAGCHFISVFQIATLSPADICYEESLSTLRYADRYHTTPYHAIIDFQTS